ncbi:hypothetical protein ABTM81_20660, partial [Acinetobacter baumannii]
IALVIGEPFKYHWLLLFALEVNMLLSPVQKLNGLLLLIVGIVGNALTVMVVGVLAALVQLPFDAVNV